MAMDEVSAAVQRPEQSKNNDRRGAGNCGYTVTDQCILVRLSD